MNNDQPEILQNVVLMGTLISWAMAVLIKGAIALFKTKTLTASDFFGPGGMPSTHTSPVLTCTVLTGYVAGWDTPLFALACTFASVVMYDASGVRRAAGKHAQAINLIFKGMFEQGHFQNQKLETLREILGHRPVEVLVGAGLGIAVAIAVNNLWLIRIGYEATTLAGSP